MKKLIPGILMLLISAVLLSTASYAWFSMNDKVTATGMQVQAVTDGSLYISNAHAKPAYTDITDGSVDFNMNTCVELRPTSTIDVTNWYASAAARADQYDKASSTAYTPVAVANVGQYRLLKTVYVRSEKNFDNLVVTGVTIESTHGSSASGSDVLEKSITVAFNVTQYWTTTAQDNEATAVTDDPVFVANEDPDATTTVGSATVTRRNGGVTSGSPNPVLDSTLTFVDIADIPNTTKPVIWARPNSLTADVSNYVYQIDIYIYFDGESVSCYSNALLNVITLDSNVTVEFSTTSNPTQGG